MASVQKPVGQTIPVRVTWTNPSGDVTDPATVELKVEEPDGTETTYLYPAAITKDATGIYSKTVTLAAAGYWVLRWKAAGGGVDAVATEVVEALPSELVDDATLEPWTWVSLQEARAFVGARSTADDGQIAGMINAACSAFMKVSGREFARTGVETRTFTVDEFAQATGELRIGDAATVTGVVINDRYGNEYATLDSGDWRTRPENPPAEDPAIRRVEFLGNTTSLPSGAGYRVEVTGEFGFPEVPWAVKQAILEEVESRYGKDIERQSEVELEVGSDVWSPNAGGPARMLSLFAWETAQRYRDPVLA